MKQSKNTSTSKKPDTNSADTKKSHSKKTNRNKAAAKKPANKKRAGKGRTKSPVSKSPNKVRSTPTAKAQSAAPRARATSTSTVPAANFPSDVPLTPDALHTWIATHLGVRIARTSLIEHHAAPFDYLVHTFFEGNVPQDVARAYQPVFRAPRPKSPPENKPAALITDSQSTNPLPPSSSSSSSKSKSSSLPSSPDCTVWANRGGGKTFLAAIATLLDLLFKRACQVRILAGSIEQGRRMHDHLRSFLERDELGHITYRITARRISIPAMKSAVEILAASQASVRGTRVQKLRCDEVDLFDHELWSAAQLVTRSLPNVPGPWGTTIRGSVEALSTMHKPFGLMWKLVGDPNVARASRPCSDLLVTVTTESAVVEPPCAPPPNAIDAASLSSPPSLRDPRALRGESSSSTPRTLFRWGLLDVLEHCPPERDCSICPLEPECQGRAKFTPLTCEGHITIDDAVNMKFRVGRETWESEMLCLRPSRSSAVYPEFDPRIHVRRWHGLTSPCEISSSSSFSFMIAGFDFGYRSEAVILLAGVTRTGRVHIIREHCKREQILDQQIDALDRWREERLFRFRNQPGHEPPLEFVGTDPAGNAKDPHTGKTSAQLLTARGYQVRNRASEIYPGLNLVRDLLNPAWMPRVARRSAPVSSVSSFSSSLLTNSPATSSLSPRSAWGPSLFRGDQYDPSLDFAPKLLIDPCCTRLIECLSRYHFNESKPESLEPEKDGFDHACDALRYMILNHVNPYKSEVSNYTH